MATFPSGLTQIIVGFSDLFSKRAWPLVQVLLAGAILAVGPRTVAAVLRVMGTAEERQFLKYHRVLNRVKVDDMIERRRGARIAAKGIYRDPLRSSRSHFVKGSGLRWLCLMLIAPISWAERGKCCGWSSAGCRTG